MNASRKDNSEEEGTGRRLIILELSDISVGVFSFVNDEDGVSNVQFIAVELVLCK